VPILQVQHANIDEHRDQRSRYQDSSSHPNPRWYLGRPKKESKGRTCKQNGNARNVRILCNCNQKHAPKHFGECCKLAKRTIEAGIPQEPQ
jgi:hypothetical protein